MVPLAETAVRGRFRGGANGRRVWAESGDSLGDTSMPSRLIATACGIALLLSGQVLAQPAPAQQPQGQPPPVRPQDVVPEKMPFDVPYGAPIGLERAQAVVAAVMAECGSHGWKMNVAVVDSGANLVAFGRMDGAQLASVAISQHKARAAATFRRETRAYEDAIQNNLPYVATLDGVIASRGGIPLVEDGRLVGAVGVSGGTGSQDEVCAKAGAATVK